MKNAMIEACELGFIYDNEEKTLALDGIDVSVDQGSFVAIIGSNASGKSTLAYHCNALLSPTSGKFYVLGKENCVEAENYIQIRKNVGLVFQNPDSQALIGIVEEDVAFGLCNLGLPPAEIELRVKEALKAVKMEGYRDHLTQRLSCGQKQKVALAGVLAMRPSCIVLDEATAMLDPVSRQEILEILDHLRADYNITVVFITHNMNEAMHADRILVLARGRVILDGRPSEVFSKADTLIENDLELPPLIQLMHELAQAGCPVPSGVLSFDECEDFIFRMLTAEDSR